MSLARRGAPIAALALLAACAQPVPTDRLEYVGEWRAETMAILITAEGDVAYRRSKEKVTTSLSGPLKRFEGADFVVGLGPLSTTFDVSEPPHLEDGQWKMTVDGVELTRVSDEPGLSI